MRWIRLQRDLPGRSESLSADSRYCCSRCAAIKISGARFSSTSGGGAVMQGERLERDLRDLPAVEAHLFVSDFAYQSLGRLRLGIADRSPLGQGSVLKFSHWPVPIL